MSGLTQKEDTEQCTKAQKEQTNKKKKYWSVDMQKNRRTSTKPYCFSKTNIPIQIKKNPTENLSQHPIFCAL